MMPANIPVDWYPWLCNIIEDPPFKDPDIYLHSDQYNFRGLEGDREPNKLSEWGTKGMAMPHNYYTHSIKCDGRDRLSNQTNSVLPHMMQEQNMESMRVGDTPIVDSVEKVKEQEEDNQHSPLGDALSAAPYSPWQKAHYPGLNQHQPNATNNHNSSHQNNAATTAANQPITKQ